MPRIIAIANQKGGVGKTTTTVNLSAALAKLGRRVLVLDIDPQGNATSGLGIDKHSAGAGIYDVFTGAARLEEVLVPTEQETLLVAPSNTDLVGVELELSVQEGREAIIKREIASLSAHYDYVIMDCPPSLGLLTVNALVAAHSVLVPLQSEYYALEGVSALLKTVELARERLNENLEIEGVLLTMYDARTNLSRQVERETREYFGDKVFQTVVPRNVKISESPSFGKPIIFYDPYSVGAGAYESLARELERKLGFATDESPAESLRRKQVARMTAAKKKKQAKGGA